MANKTKTILIYIWDLGLGGIQKRVIDIVVYLNQNYPQYRVVLLIKYAFSTPLLKFLKKRKIVDIHVYQNNIKKNIFSPFLTIIWLIKNFYYFKPNLVLTFSHRFIIQLIFVKKILFMNKFKLILSQENYTSNFLAMYEKSFWKHLVKFFYPLADKIIVQTKIIKNDLISNFNVPENKIIVIPNWTIKRTKLISTSAKMNLNNKKYDFIFVGRLVKEKNVFWLIDLARYFRKLEQVVKICVLGKGTLEKEFLEQILENKLTNYFNYAGFQAKVASYLIQSKILLLPSSYEGMPNCVLEGYSLGLPVVVNNFPGAKEIVNNGKTGFIARTKKEFCNYSKLLLANDQLRKKIKIRVIKLVNDKFGKQNLKNYITALLHD